ncbi:M42 family metallopeptidase [Sulfitobacter sp. D35]|uniref:M42 family metallopeptidase n=1 Tax=Sulfitobacter sp. D35 TaxID=3083252 RepID=UPI00296FB8B2|nr:M42 family metallopeptidase [Sulfitobacter sp. D35]MDW4500030.1 M42 family metallopeptidase [Sulfitobacter sp. D35]
MIRDDLKALMRVPGLSGFEDRVAAAIRARLPVDAKSDRMGNLIATFEGAGPSVMLFTHMDQLGFVVRKIEENGFVRVHRLGGVPERALASQQVVLSVPDGDLPGVIANKMHHATTPDEKYRVLPAPEILIDAGFSSKAEAEAAGVRIGTPVTFAPNVVELAGGRIAGTSVDDRAGCAVLIDVAKRIAEAPPGPTVHVVFSTQEEFNLRGALTAAQALKPDIAIQVDLMMACDTPDMTHLGEMVLGGGPGISLMSFHGRGTLNGVLPHPGLVALAEQSAEAEGLPLQRSAQVGVLTDLSYVQLVGAGVAALDVGFPMRYSHSSLEVCDPADLDALSRLLVRMLAGIGPEFPLERFA